MPVPQLVASNPETPTGSVKRILTDLERGKDARVELAERAARYRSVCKAQGKRACSVEAFTSDVEVIKRRKEGGHVYLMDVQLGSASEVSSSA
jgi:hypothetical protein